MYPGRHSIAKRRSSIRLLPFLFFKLSPTDITYQRYRCSLDPVETGARNDRRSNYRDQHFQRYLRSDCGLASVEIVPIVRFAWSLEEDSVPADKYGARFEEEVEKKRGIQKERENRGKRGFSIRCILSILHPCPDNQAIREIGLINGDWLLHSIPVNHRCWLRSTASSHSFVKWNDSRFLCADTLTTLGLKLILFNGEGEKEREIVCYSFLFVPCFEKKNSINSIMYSSSSIIYRSIFSWAKINWTIGWIFK